MNVVDRNIQEHIDLDRLRPNLIDAIENIDETTVTERTRVKWDATQKKFFDQDGKMIQRISFQLKPENFEGYYKNGVRRYGFFKIYVLLVSIFVVWLEIKLGRRWVNAYIFTLFCHV